MSQDNEERVEYIFEGDVSSLKSATQQAIDLLGQYDQAIKQASKAGAFQASEKSTKTFNNTVAKVTKDVEKLQAKLKKVGDVKLPTGSATSDAMKQTLEVVASQMSKISGSSKLTTKDLNQMKTALQGVRTSVASAKTDTDKLISSEERFQRTLNTVKAKAEAFRNTMSGAKTTLSQTFEPINQRLGFFRNLIDGVSARIQSFKDRAAIAFDRVGKLASAVASAFRRTSTEADKGDRSASRLATAFGKIKTAASKVPTALSKIFELMKTGASRVTTLATKVQELGKRLTSLKSGTSVLKQLTQLLAAGAIAKGLAESVKQSISFVENLNLFIVAMGDSLEMGQKFVQQMSEVYGMDPSNLYQTAGYFYQLTDAIGMTDEASATMSLSLTKMSNDLASLFNMDVATVTENLASGMQGMTRAVRKYGMDIRNTTLQQTALNYGIEGQVETMSEANRMALRYLTMIDQANNAINQFDGTTGDVSTTMGDFARNIETPANQLRIFKEQITQLGRSIGNFFLPILAKILPYINGIIMALRTLLNFFSSLLGFSTSFGGEFSGAAESAADSVSSIGGAASDAATEMKKLTAPFDELNILSEDASAASGGIGGFAGDILDPALAEALKNSQLQIENIKMRANEIRDSILELLGLELDAEGNAVAVVGGFVDRIVKAWQAQDYTQVGSTIAAFLNQGLYWAIGNVTWENLGPGIQQTVNQITGLYNGFMATFDWSALGTVIGNGINIAIYTGLDFINKIDWSLSGLAMANGLNSVVATIDWAALAQMISQGLIGIITSVYTFLENTDWQAIGEAVKTFLVNIDWAGVAEATFRAIGAAFGALTSFLWGLIKDAWSSVVNWWHDNAIQDGEFTLQGLLEGMLNIVKNIGTWIKEHIFDPFIQGFKNVFGIHSPSTVMAEIGGFLLDGLFQGLANIGDRIRSWGSSLINGIKNVLGIHSPSKEFKELGAYSVAGLVQGFFGMTSITSTFQTQLTTMLTSAQSFSSENLLLIQSLLQAMLDALDDALEANTTFTKAMAKMYTKMANTSIPQINGIIAELDAIPRSITTVHTIITQSIFDGSSSSKSRSTPKMATGGVVTSPTYALIGEGRYDEAVIPLGNSPQMADLVQKIADAVDKDKDTPDTPIQVNVYIGDEEFDAYTYKASERGKKKVGAQPVKTGG